MYVFSINIILKNKSLINQTKQVINSIPYLYVSENIQDIIQEIRTGLIEDIKKYVIEWNCDFNDFILSLSIYSKNPLNMHIVSINCSNIKEVTDMMIQINADKKYQEIMDNIA